MDLCSGLERQVWNELLLLSEEPGDTLGAGGELDIAGIGMDVELANRW